MSKKWVLTILMVTDVVALYLIGGKWSRAFADNTVPTIPTNMHYHHGGEGEQDMQVWTPPPPVSGPVDPRTSKDIFYPGWGGVAYGVGAVCNAGDVNIFRLDAKHVPDLQQLFFDREILDVRNYEKGVLVQTPPCASVMVYFDLYYFERFIYNQNPNRVAIFMYDEIKNQWNKCANMALTDNGANGRLSCQAPQSGFFAVGYSAK